MFEIFVHSHFSAGHHLRDYPGNCEKPHGHNWKITATVRAGTLDHLGMGIDFRQVRKAVAEVVATLDHRDLNAHPDFADRNPSSENIAVYLYDNLKPKLTGKNYSLYSVTVRETDNTGTTYHGEIEE